MKMKKMTKTAVRGKKTACLKTLMERIILQSLEDLWMPAEREESIDFFRGERFCICADMAGMSLYEQAKLLNLANRIIDFVAAGGAVCKTPAHKNRVATFEALHPWKARISEMVAAHNYPEVSVR